MSCLFQLLLLIPVADAEPLPEQRAEPPDILVADFEAPNYGAWEVTGTAFGPGPARGTLLNQMAVDGFLGSGLVNSFFGGDGSTGTLLSQAFTIERGRINFLIGGGNHAGETCIHLLIDGQAARTATGPNSEFLRPHFWDVSDLRGKTARIQIVDRHQGGWGHINIDHIVQSDRAPRFEDDRDAAIARAAASVKKAAERAEQDPARPLYHFRAPGNWMNDPNGPIHYGGYFHVFYQHNPYGDAWGHMHWGHARSRDLVHWEHLPIALWPSLARGEEHCFSGCAVLTGAGLDGERRPIIFYTSIGHPEPECWAAVPEDEELLRWEKHPASPVLTAGSAPVKLHEWRDPFVFRAEGKTFMVHGGNLNATKGGQAAVSLYEAKSADLARWEYKSILFVHPDAQVKNIECPNFFPLGGKWVLITSPHRACDYFVGTFDAAAGKFQAEKGGLADWSTNYYAPNCFEDSAGRRLLWGWIKDFPGGRSWNGCFTLPRVLSIGPDGLLRQLPAPELAALRGEHRRDDGIELTEEKPFLLPNAGDAIEIVADLERGSAARVALRVRCSADGTRAVEIGFDGEKLDVAGVSVPLKLAESEKALKLRVFLDRSVLEVYAADGRECITRVLGAKPEDQGLELRASGGKATARKVEIWRLKPIW